MSELVSEATQAEEGSIGTEVNPINRNHYQKAALANLRLEPFSARDGVSSSPSVSNRAWN